MQMNYYFKLTVHIPGDKCFELYDGHYLCVYLSPVKHINIVVLKGIIVNQN